MKKAFKIAGISLLALLALLVLIVLGYVVYVAAEYDRIEDYLQLTVDEGATEAAAHTGVEYGIVTYNIGFGAYSPDFPSFWTAERTSAPAAPPRSPTRRGQLSDGVGRLHRVGQRRGDKSAQYRHGLRIF